MIKNSEPQNVIRPNPLELKFFDPHLNEEQKRAVSNGIIRYHLKPPFLLFGAFGTGKTRTIIEMIRQVLMWLCIEYQIISKNSNLKLLVCGCSNSSVDSILKTLLAHYNPQVNQGLFVIFIRKCFKYMLSTDQSVLFAKNGLNTHPITTRSAYLSFLILAKWDLTK